MYPYNIERHFGEHYSPLTLAVQGVANLKGTLAYLIQYNEDEVKSRQQGILHTNIIHWVLVFIILKTVVKLTILLYVLTRP